MKKIVVNTRWLRKNAMDGIGWFTYNTLQYIVQNNPSITFHFLFDSGIKEEFLFGKNVVPHNLFPPAKHAALNVIWFEVSCRILLNKINPDLFLSPDGICCLGWKGRQYAVIHDLNFIYYPKDLKFTNRIYYNYFIKKSAEKATRIGTVSDFSKQDLVKKYKIAPSKIDVVYNGINSFFIPLREDEKKSVKNKYSNGNDYFLFVGTLHPRKNILRLLQAFESFKNGSKSNIQLLIAGKELYRTDELHAYHQSMNHHADVRFLGRLPDADLQAVMSSAYCLVYVPYFEGFGIPIVEAMNSRVPVITSNVTSMPEIAGDAALIVDPFNINEIADGMEIIATNEEVRQNYITKGIQRAADFSWKQTAELLWNGIVQCL
ncbi:MAG: glycosyltransferase family 4 protein [Bacteroidota bacterium]|nr:glycosyltransferase family 4 protein [Bacteroidota bacterium]